MYGNIHIPPEHASVMNAIDNIDAKEVVPIGTLQKSPNDSRTEETVESSDPTDKEKKLTHVKIIGKAGIGKSTYIKNNYPAKEYVLTAFTCISAVQIEGRTLSSIFHLGRENDNSIKYSTRRIGKRVKLFIQLAKGMVVDEFYTVPADIMSNVNDICKAIRSSDEPFGGLQLVLVGDDRQTEAVGDPFVNSELYKSLKFETIDLPEHDKMRLSKEYMAFCNMFRNPRLNRNKIIRLLKDPRFSQKKVEGRTVYYTNEEVNRHNRIRMKKMETEVVVNYDGHDYKKGCPIYIKGCRNGKLCNGMLGTLLDAKGDILTIETDFATLDISVKNVSFQPAFAMTIHKAQCKTFKGINIHLAKKSIFEERKKLIRLLYTAMTRVRSFDKCYVRLY